MLPLNICFAQQNFKPGYIIKNSGDTVFGQIDYVGDIYNSQNCTFRLNSSKETVRYYPGDISAYRIIDGKFFVTKKVTIDSIKKVVFLEYLVDGIARLYYYPPNVYFIQKDSSGLQILENNDCIINENSMQYAVPSHQYIG